MGNYVKNQEILEAVHKLDKGLGVHITYCKLKFKQLDEVIKEVDGNNGIKYQTKILYAKYEEEKEESKDEKEDKRQAWFDLKTAVIMLILTIVSQFAVSRF